MSGAARRPAAAARVRAGSGDVPEALGAVLASSGLTTEALAWRLGEALVLERLAQRTRRAVRPRRGLGLGAGDRFLDRWVAFRGERSGRVHLVAHVEVAARRTATALVEALENTDATLGELVRAFAPDARREPIGVVVVERLPREAARVAAGPGWRRRYRIVGSAGVLALVTEYFPKPLVDATHARAS